MTEKRAESIMIPEEANYQRTMKRDVEPYLRNCEKDGYIESYDSTAIYYRTYRIPQAKAAIVISHGFCEFAEKYKEVIYYFLKNGYSVYVPEHRGHGYSDRIVVDGEKVYIEDYEQYVQDLHFFVKNVVELTEKRKILFCHSMGGAIGVRYLEEFPMTFDAAILSAPMLGMNTGKYPKWLAKSFSLREALAAHTTFPVLPRAPSQRELSSVCGTEGVFSILPLSSKKFKILLTSVS